jgi:hypothetical protein
MHMSDSCMYVSCIWIISSGSEIRIVTVGAVPRILTYRQHHTMTYSGVFSHKLDSAREFSSYAHAHAYRGLKASGCLNVSYSCMPVLFARLPILNIDQ